jgi:hypothetical protein
VLEQSFGLELDWSQRVFEAQIANESVAALLALRTGDPVMYVRQLVFLRDGTPIELSDLWIRGDHFRLSANVERDETLWLSNHLREVLAPTSDSVLGEQPEPDPINR